VAEQLPPIDLSDGPDLLRVVDEVAATRRPRRLQRDGRDVVTINPAPPQAPAGRRVAVFTRNDALWDIVGLIDDADGPTDVSSNKQQYLAEAYSPKRQ
jgi:hypothetical protein